ncbi:MULTISPECIES: WecB/TagA/CpsF family glycosyltransferase [Pseudomonas]|uniref:WecB/TagA/CpsF family glycosyltransferase n=1 Tax=Pseudomonas TaxID=286 RepID=UPI00147454F2|nr:MULTISPECIES: WecB/TagA/CpsF family glycosyltransferase [Pseudomonas]MBM1204799.1 WecB/TagA/CpsF family glycosyltransferase [Pseudomonas fragi]MBM1204895.1 WecB/TagA/CpsF family glycosyltransferase [Pseudomonas fragi]NMY57975.1 WecB/TagA/CpsF family glycosyltransferase [Pseudomonas sp. WS 5051]
MISTTKKSRFGIDFYNGSKDSLITEIRNSIDGPYKYIVTPNINHVVHLKENRELRASYASSKHQICDSRVLLPVLRVLGIKLPEAIPGSDLTNELLLIGNNEHWSVTVIGGSNSDIQALKDKLQNIKIHHYNPPMGFIDNEQEVLKCIEFTGKHISNLIIFAVGCPRQEILAHRLHMAGNAKGIGLCVGASINFMTGSVKRAPLFMQKTGTEWIYRIIAEPRRLAKRYAVDALKFIPILVAELLERK